MTHKYFTFFAAMLSIVCLMAFPISQLGSNIHVIIASALVLFVGIPHGAIDHILDQKKGHFKPRRFYSFYFVGMLGGLVCWYFWPKQAFLGFLLLSAFHFGQSQFAQIGVSEIIKTFLYLLWGLSLLSGIILYKFQELSELVVLYPDLSLLHDTFNVQALSICLWICTAFVALLFLIFLVKGIWDLKVFLKEAILFVLLHFTFYLLPFLVGFILYFTVFHSLLVLGQEYDFLKSKAQISNVKQFVKLLAPYTLLSIVGLGIGFCLVYYDWLHISYFLLLIVFISVLTIPHSVVMDRFYKK